MKHRAKTREQVAKPSAPAPQNRSPHIESVVRACRILNTFKADGHLRRLDEIASNCDLPKPTAYRLLTTLVACGMIERPEKNRYRMAVRQIGKASYRIGYASQSEEFSFSRLVSDSIRSSAYSAGIDLLVLSNRLSPKAAIENAETFVREGVDFVIEFQTSEKAAPTISSRLREANIPSLAIEIPHPDAYYFGANNYRAGVMAGHALAQACLAHWDGRPDEVLLLELPAAGALPQSRLTGTLAGLRELLPQLPNQQVRFLNGRGFFENSLNVTRRHLNRSSARRTLISAVNDESCLGALSAFREAGRAEQCLAVGQNASIEARQEMRQTGTRLVGSVGYFPEQYGDAVISLALRILNGHRPPLATFVKHQMITAANVDVHYPNDRLSIRAGGDSLLYSSR